MRMRARALGVSAISLVGAVVWLGPARVSSTAQPAAVIVYDAGNRSASFAAVELRQALAAKGLTAATAAPATVAAQTAPVQVVLSTVDGRLAGQPTVTGLQPQGYAIRKVTTPTGSRWWAVGRDAAGMMYAGLELAEDVRIRGDLSGTTDRQVNPAIVGRGIKLNIPLDARTPSYSDDSTSAQANIAEMWSMDFWTAFLDDMARHRYNFLSLWSLSPFPSLVKVPEYPNVALADVKRKAGPLWDATLQGPGMYDPAWTLETVKTMTIDQKIAFWREVMEYARDRGIDVSVFTWNIFVYGTEQSGYGITDSPANPTTRDYVRRSVRALFDTYPLLAGIGITSGENMGNLDEGGKEQWMWESYGLGVSDAIANARNPASPFYRPARSIRLIHRAHQADLSKIVSEFRRLPAYDEADSTLAFSFKYSQAHMHSSTAPQFIHQNKWFETIPAGKKTWLTVRNDDLYYMRWGDPDFVRDYWTHLPDPSKIAGFYMGPDGYTWGRDFVSRDTATPRPTVIARQWYSFLLWGRLAYEPSLPNSRFRGILAARFPQVSSEPVFNGLTAVSKIVPAMTRFYWGSLDFMWYPEASWSNAGYATVQDLITPKYPPMQADEDGQTPRMMSIKAFVDGQAPAGRLTPLEVADLIEMHARTGMNSIDGLTSPNSSELAATLDDIRGMAWLGRYYAEKIRGAVDLYRYQKTLEPTSHARARTHLQAAAGHWREYATIWSTRYLGQVLTRMGLTPVDIKAIQTFVDRDVPAALAAQ